jgi:hypothetical protein
MADTPRTLSYLTGTSFPDNKGIGSLTVQDVRDFIVSVNRLFELYSSPSYDNDTQAAAGGVAVGSVYRNGNFVMVRLS